MDIEHELERLLDRYKLENEIRNIYYKEKGFLEGYNLWMLLLMLMSSGGFGSNKEEKQ